MTFATVAIAALALAGPAVARPSRTRSTPPPPPQDTVDSGDVNEHDTSSSTSTASCSAEVKASTWSNAQSAYVDLIADITTDFCYASDYFGYFGIARDAKLYDGKIKAVAELLLESKLKCDTTGKYAIACARSWASAYSFAAAGVELYSSAWADGNNGLSKCKCAVTVESYADALTSSWAEIWVSIYESLDDHVCAQSYDGTPDSVKSEINIHCVGNLFLKFWVKAIAQVITYGKCEPEEYLACESCCVNPAGGYYPDCDVEDCKTQCSEHEHATLIATATAAIDFKEESSAICNVDKTIDYETYWYSYVPDDHFDAKVYGANATYAFCKAYASGSAFASSASDQAVIIKGIWENTCNPLSWAGQGHDDFDKKVQAWANAYVEVLTVAHTYCVANGGDVDYDGGCALAKTYASSYAEACAEAFVASFVDFAYGKKDSCHCDIGVSVLVGSITHEIATISAFYETEVEARSCTPDVSGTPDYAYIKQKCWASSMADMVAKSMATVSLEGNCAPSGDDKIAYCETVDCKDYETGSDDWEVCLTECTKNTDAAIHAALETSAKITVNVKEYCNGFDGQRFGETYLNILNGYATSTQEPTPTPPAP